MIQARDFSTTQRRGRLTNPEVSLGGDRFDRQVQMFLRPGHEFARVGGVGPYDSDLGVYQTKAEENFPSVVCGLKR